jgi:hypothetical protein
MSSVNNIETLVDRAREWVLERIQRERPWQGLGGLPLRVTDGKPYEGTNIPLLWMQQEALGSPSNAWGTFQTFLRRGEPVASGQAPGTAIRFLPLSGGNTEAIDSSGTTGRWDFQSRSTGVTLPVSLYNRAQTVAYAPTSVPAISDSSRYPQAVHKLVDEVLARHADDSIAVSLAESSFIARFTFDVARILSGIDPSSVRGSYPADAMSVFADPSTDLKRLCGISATVIRIWSRTPSSQQKSGGQTGVHVATSARAAEEEFDRILGIVTRQGVVYRRPESVI